MVNTCFLSRIDRQNKLRGHWPSGRDQLRLQSQETTAVANSSFVLRTAHGTADRAMFFKVPDHAVANGHPQISRDLQTAMGKTDYAAFSRPCAFAAAHAGNSRRKVRIGNCGGVLGHDFGIRQSFIGALHYPPNTGCRCAPHPVLGG